MKKAYLTFLLGLSSIIGYSQINGPDTVCLGGNPTFTTAHEAGTYAWSVGNVDTDPSSISGSSVIRIDSSLSGISMQFDGGRYYAFVTVRSGYLLKLDFGTQPYPGTPVVTNLGNFGVLGDSTISIDILKDDNGNWHGFTLDGKKLVRFSFGSSLNNTPTATATTINSFAYPYFVTVRKFNSEWVGFVLNRSFSTISRLEFGNSLANVPVATSLGLSFGLLSAPVNMTLHQWNGNWFALVTNIGAGGGPGGGDRLVRLAFGTDLKNNTPNETNFNNPNNRLANPRAIVMVGDCDTSYALIANENNHRLIKIEFVGGNITGNASGVDLGTVGIPSSETNAMSPFWYNNRLHFIGTSFDSTIYLYDNVYNLPTGGTTSYTNSGYTRTFNTGGTYTVTLHADQGDVSGSRTICRNIVVLGNIKVAIKQSGDTLVASGTLCDNYVWKFNGVIIPGVNTQKYLPVEGFGVYTVTGTTAGCSATSNYQYWPVSVNNVLQAENVIISPNPSNGVFNININGVKGSVAIQCYNVMGANVASKIAEANGRLTTSVDLSNLPKGIYQVKIQTADGATIVKQALLQ